MDHSYLLGKPNTRICWPEEKIIVVLSHLMLEQPEGLNSKRFGQIGELAPNQPPGIK